MFKLYLLALVFTFSSCQRNVEIIDNGFRFKPSRFKKAVPGENTLRGEAEKFLMLEEKTGDELSPDDYATFEINWKFEKSDKEETTFFTIGPSGEKIIRDCGENGPITKKCPPNQNLKEYSLNHPLNSILRHIFNGRGVNSVAQIFLGQAQAKAWNEEFLLRDQKRMHQEIDSKKLFTEKLIITAKLLGACYPRWERITTTTYSIPAMTNTRVTTNFLGCVQE